MGCSPFHVTLERTELGIPVRLDILEPGSESGQPVGPQVEHTQAGVIPASFIADDAGIEEDPQVATHGGGRQARGVGDCTRPHRPFRQQRHYPSPGGIAEHTQEVADIRRHRRNS
jgi:hypothetical protein